jgi:hypothetical protein
MVKPSYDDLETTLIRRKDRASERRTGVTRNAFARDPPTPWQASDKSTRFKAKE